MERATQQLINAYFSPDEGELHQIYGKVKNCKTLYATRLAFEYLMAGQTVVTNWKLKWTGYDERESTWKLILGFLGLKKSFRKIPFENWIYLDPTDPDIPERVARLTDCTVMLDEGHQYYDSYVLTRISQHDRNSILFTGHFNRRIIIISQRSKAIHVTYRSQVNRFFKTEKIFHIPFTDIIRFRVTEFQMMLNEDVDETQPEREFTFWAGKNTFALYDYKAMRGNTPRSQPNYADIWYPKYSELLTLWKGRKQSEIIHATQISLPQVLQVPKPPAVKLSTVDD